MINVTDLTNLITQFRATINANSVTPETVGSILQKIVDILATAGTQANVDIINQWHEALKSAAPALTALSQGAADRNHVYLNAKSVNLYTGAQSSLSPIQIQQATTERAGAMRAQQVIDLNANKKSISEINSKIATISSILGVDTGENMFAASQISVAVINGTLHLIGYKKLKDAGYVPYLFRSVRKRNPYKNKFATAEQRAEKKYCPVKKGWAIFGSMYSIQLIGSQVAFSTLKHHEWSKQCDTFSTSASTLVSRNVRKDGTATFGLGRSSVSLADPKNPKKERMIRLTFGIGFAKPMRPSTAAITPANLVSTLATFHIVYDPGTGLWKFST